MYSPFGYAGFALSKRRPIHLTFFVTRRCNSRCPFCFYLKSEDPVSAGSRELQLDEIERVSSSFGSLLWLAFSGGEIFLRPDIAEISRIFYRNNKPAIMLFPTNGMLPKVIREEIGKILENCPRSIVTVKLSLDGVGDRHDAVRDTPGSFGKTMETYELLRGLLQEYPNFELGVNTVFCSDNQNETDEIIDFVGRMDDIKTHTLSLVRGDLSDARHKEVDMEKYHRAAARLEDGLKQKTAGVYRFRGARIKAAQDILQRRLIHRTMLDRRRVTPCYAGRLNLVLREDGSVYPCEVLSRSLGNVRDYDLDIRRLLASPDASAVVSAIASGDCYCTHECYFMTNILFNPRLYPSLFKEYLHVR